MCDRKNENPRGRELGTPTGATGRVGPVQTAEPPPRRGSGLITATESATPQAETQSSGKTPSGPRGLRPGVQEITKLGARSERAQEARDDRRGRHLALDGQREGQL